jgi:hypothetical protein
VNIQKLVEETWGNFLVHWSFMITVFVLFLFTNSANEGVESRHEAACRSPSWWENKSRSQEGEKRRVLTLIFGCKQFGCASAIWRVCY